VLVVGGGPAGSACAYGLRDSGLDVVVADRREFPRDKICAGWVTPQVGECLDLDWGDYAKARVLQPIHGFRTRRLGGPEACTRSPEVVSYGIRRFEFDHYLLARSGARLRLGTPVRALERSGERWVLNGELEARLVVGAGGHFCPVARRFGGSGAAEPIVAAQELEIELSDADAARCPVDPEVPELYFTEDLKGYGWLFRKGRWLNVGLGRQDRRRLQEHVAAFLGFLRDAGRLPFELPGGLHGHAYLLHGQAPRPLVPAPGVLLAGDAAGLAYPRSGEGIRPAVESGLLAARCIRALGLRAGEAVGAAYASALEARLGPRHPRARPGLTSLLPASWAQAAAGRLLGSSWFARRIVVDRWFTHRAQPALCPDGARAAGQRRIPWHSSPSSPPSP
jgi:flavin-dependent dehydrogenase